MNLKKCKFGFLALATSIFLAYSCNQNTDPLLNNTELVFPNSLKIDVKPYSYYNSDSSEVFLVIGDSAIVDTVNSTPVFKWTNLITGLMTVVISKEDFQVSDNNIVNADQIIWQWQSGLESNKVVQEVHFYDGHPVVNKEIQYDTIPIPLENGMYYWAIWSWESSGREIIYSSKPLKMVVK